MGSQLDLSNFVVLELRGIPPSQPVPRPDGLFTVHTCDRRVHLGVLDNFNEVQDYIKKVGNGFVVSGYKDDWSKEKTFIADTEEEAKKIASQML